MVEKRKNGELTQSNLRLIKEVANEGKRRGGAGTVRVRRTQLKEVLPPPPVC